MSPNTTASDTGVALPVSASFSKGWRPRVGGRAAVAFGLRLLIIVAFIGFWELAAGPPGEGGFVLVDEFYVSQPTDIVEALRTLIDRGVLLDSVLHTYYEVLVGFGLGAFGGMIVGFLLGMNRFLSEVLQPIVAALYAVPRLALIPLFIIWFGIGTSSVIALTTLLTFFLIFYNTYSGVSDVDEELLDVLRVMNASRIDLIRKVMFPSALTWILAGFRISVPYALVAAVTGEMIASNRGMGYQVIRASGQFYTAGVFASIVVLMAMALVLSGVVTILEKRLLAWKSAGQHG